MLVGCHGRRHGSAERGRALALWAAAGPPGAASSLVYISANRCCWLSARPVQSLVWMSPMGSAAPRVCRARARPGASASFRPARGALALRPPGVASSLLYISAGLPGPRVCASVARRGVEPGLYKCQSVLAGFCTARRQAWYGWSWVCRARVLARLTRTWF